MTLTALSFRFQPGWKQKLQYHKVTEWREVRLGNEVMRPGVYRTHPGESAGELIRRAGGLQKSFIWLPDAEAKPLDNKAEVNDLITRQQNGRQKRKPRY